MVAVRYEQEISYGGEPLGSPVLIGLDGGQQFDGAQPELAKNLVMGSGSARALLAQFLIGLLCVVLVWGIASGFSRASSGVSAQDPTIELPSSHLVLPGETLWGIVRDRFPTGDIRGEVDRLSGQLGGSQLQVGQLIRFNIGDGGVAEVDLAMG